MNNLNGGWMMLDVVTFGETMVQLGAKSTGYMRHCESFSAKIAGAESNVAIGLSRLGYRSGWISRVGNDEFGKKVISTIRGEGVDVSEVVYDEEAQTGVFFKEALTENEVRVYYYRQDSAASRYNPSDLNEAYIAQAKYVHITGITPALSENCYKATMKLIEISRKHGVTVVFDPNLRRKLWPEKKARRTLLEIIKSSDIVLPGIDECVFLFGDNDPEVLAQRLMDNGPNIVVIKLGAEGSFFLTNYESGFVEGFSVDHVVDPVGAGDGFATGFLSGLLDRVGIENAVIRGNAIGALVTMVRGDIEGLPDKGRLNSFIKNEDLENVGR